MFERKLAQSVQRDYLQAAEQHRLKESGHNRSFTKTVIIASLTFTTLAVAFMIINQFGIF
jgi:hypothetical protein